MESITVKGQLMYTKDWYYVPNFSFLMFTFILLLQRNFMLLEFIPFGFSDVPYAQLIPGCISADKTRNEVVR